MCKHPGLFSGKEMLLSHDDFITQVQPVLQVCDFRQYRGAGNTYKVILDMPSTYAQDICCIFLFVSTFCDLLLCFVLSVHFWICSGGFFLLLILLLCV